ncbi:MAG TPA: Ada metal-binding domain-containing protein [Reyranella sp.]|nr:Ada metal-binding domain-containing protein [Reyranella sp.]
MKAGSPESDSIVMPIIATLDHDECERAGVRRDRRYDGHFFSGVRTTRIYCRPRPARAGRLSRRSPARSRRR